MKTIKLLILALLISANASAGTQIMSKQEFTSAFVKVLTTEINDSSFVTVSDLQVHTDDIAGYELNISLDNAFDVYLSGQRTLDEVFHDQINSIKNRQAVFSSNNVKSIFPVLKPRAYLENAKKQLRDAGYDKDTLPFYFEPLNDDIYVLYVFDTPESMRYVSTQDLEKLHIKSAQVRTIAIKNIDNYYSKIGAQVQQIDTKGNGSVYLFIADESYEASALVSTYILEKANLSAKGELVVFAPARNIVLIVDSEDKAGLQIASSFASQGYAELGYSISPYGYKKVLGKWQRYQL